MTSFTQVGILLVFICTFSSGAVISLEERFAQLETKFYQMEETNIQLEKKVTNLEAQLKQNNEDKEGLASQVTELKSKVQQQEKILSVLLKEKKEPSTDFNNSINTHQSAVAINGLPSTCADLKSIGHILNGFYSVMGPAMMESVYCDFTKLPGDAGFQKWIGVTDVKSVPVHFYVRLSSSFNTTGVPIPFDLTVVNEGNAMDLPSGIFTAPRNGIYFFSFMGLAEFRASTSRVFLDFFLYLNGVHKATGFIEEGNTIANQDSPFSLQSTLKLKEGDQVWLSIYGLSPGAILVGGGGGVYTHYTGFMLEEEIVASL